MYPKNSLSWMFHATNPRLNISIFKTKEARQQWQASFFILLKPLEKPLISRQRLFVLINGYSLLQSLALISYS
jgi:hypothetical protein